MMEETTTEEDNHFKSHPPRSTHPRVRCIEVDASSYLATVEASLFFPFLVSLYSSLWRGLFFCNSFAFRSGERQTYRVSLFSYFSLSVEMISPKFFVTVLLAPLKNETSLLSPLLHLSSGSEGALQNSNEVERRVPRRRPILLAL
jgi:hypothetical protein